jgi:molecular chaperone DnaK
MTEPRTRDGLVGFGIDFGTTNSVVGVCEAGRTRSVLNEDGKPHPSVVWFRADGQVTVGTKAKHSINAYATEPGNAIIASVKRQLGQNKNFRVAGQPKSAVEVASEIFQFLKQDAKERDDLHVQQGVVTIPVDFDGAARHELRRAAERAGFYIKTFIHEPFAAVVAYCCGSQNRRLDALEGQNILVFDWGGGTLDITVATIRAGRMIQLAKADLGHRAGDHFDEKLMRLTHHRFLAAEKFGVEEAPIRPTVKDRYLAECERAKIALSDSEEDRVDLADFLRLNNNVYDIEQRVYRSEFESVVGIDVQDSMAKVDAAVEEARLTPRDIDLVLLIGGSSRIPLVQREMEERFGARIVPIPNADTIIAKGAALVDYLGMHPVLARSLGVRLSDGAYYEVFGEATLAKPEVCRKTINFFCTDNRDGEAKLILVEKFDGREQTKKVLPLPVSRDLPRKHNDSERVTVTFSLDDDLILQVFGKGATKQQETSMAVHDLLFALGTEAQR